jgi:hypothetical protein
MRGIEAAKIQPISKAMVDELAQIVGSPRNLFTIECFATTRVQDGEIVAGEPFVDVAWFDRGPEVQDRVAECITRFVHQAGYESVDMYFTLMEKNRYYDNGKVFGK